MTTKEAKVKNAFEVLLSSHTVNANIGIDGRNVGGMEQQHARTKVDAARRASEADSSMAQELIVAALATVVEAHSLRQCVVRFLAVAAMEMKVGK